MNENIIEASIISVGKYEILFSSIPTDEFENEYIIQYLNNAAVKFLGTTGLQHKIDWKELGESINQISFTMPKDEDKLSDIFATTPYGLIKKNRTGVGATTLELKSARNSIVVVPTRALAYNKAKQSKIEGTNKYEILYIGGKISGFKVPKIKSYLSDDSISNKKFIVVADSLPNLLEEIGQEHYKDYFFMVDEIDSYQYDSYYRESLENVIDYYFEFPPTKRCLVSATVGKFSDKRIEEEPVININFNHPQPRNIKLLHTPNVVTTTVKQIKNTLLQHPDEKILIAYNSVRNGILHIIESLDETTKDKCAVLCSIKSKPYVKNYYAEEQLSEGHLPNQITFMTCTYFVGIDISERFHLISIADSDLPFTLLSEDKFLQIAGRCRNEEGLISETIIYKSKERTTPADVELEKQIEEDSFLLINYLNAIPKLKTNFKKLKKGLDKINTDAIVKQSSKNYYGIQEIKLLRFDINKIIKPAYFNWDNIIIQFKLLNTLYSSKEHLAEALRLSENIVDFEDLEEIEERISPELQESLEEDFIIVEEEEIDTIIEDLRAGNSLDERGRIALRKKSNSTKHGEVFIDRFLELQNYVAFDELVEILPQKKSQAEYKMFYNSIRFWALSEKHSFKIAFKERFPLNAHLSGDTIKERLNELLRSNVRNFVAFDKKDNKKAYKYLDIFCKRSDSKHRVRSRRQGNLYIIESYNVNNLNSQPLNVIDASTHISDIFKF